MPRRPRVGAVVLAAFLLVPLIELAIAIQVGRWIGVVPTVLLLLVESLIGAWIVGREGAAAWRALNDQLRTGRTPTRELADAALVLAGGLLLLTPGFLTDVAGFALVLPFTRPAARRLLTAWLGRSVTRRLVRATGPVLRGEVLDDPTVQVIDVRDLPDERKGRPPPGGCTGRGRARGG